MIDIEAKQTVFVFDLDDTLYPEADYQDSGLNAICDLVNSLYKINIKSELFNLKLLGEEDLLGAVCRIAKLPSSLKDSLLWVYRLHEPSIKISKKTQRTLKLIEEKSKAIVILTDGRSISQRYKIKALGLNHLPFYISEDYESEKPSRMRYEKIMLDFSASSYVYVGDNLSKDFIAPNELGWKSIGLTPGHKNIHKNLDMKYSSNHEPSIWISDLSEIINFLR